MLILIYFVAFHVLTTATLATVTAIAFSAMIRMTIGNAILRIAVCQWLVSITIIQQLSAFAVILFARLAYL